MSAHLFEDARATRTPSRQSSLVAASVIVHVALLVALVIAGILLPGVLPAPHSRALAWRGPQMVRLRDIPLPPQRTVANTPAPAESSSNAAPIDAPTGIAPEVERPLVPAPSPGVVEGTANAEFGAVLAPPPPPPPPPAPQPGPIRMHSGIAAPVKTRDVAPQYPAIARAAGAHGVVIIEATIDTTGMVVGTRVLRSVPLLDEAALTAVRQWQFTPARLNGEPVSVLITVTVNFTLDLR